VTTRNPFRFPFTPHPLDVTRLATANHAPLSRQIEAMALKHVHLDWQTLPEMLRSSDFRCRMAREGAHIRAAVGATLNKSPYDPKLVAWLRLLLPGDSPRHDAALDLAWEALRADLVAEGVALAGMLSIDPWVEIPAERWGFARTNSVVTLRRDFGPVPDRPRPPLTIRDVRAADLDAVADVDGMAFESIWHHDKTTLEGASRQAATFTVLEDDRRILGYQLSTWHIDTGHLARLAIRPEMQGQGLGGLLVGEMIRFFMERNIYHITVNTQENNLASQRLYQRLGFKLVGHSVAYWSTDLS
jgi:ribosomal-protein-alanine N-acetyltransferase